MVPPALLIASLADTLIKRSRLARPIARGLALTTAALAFLSLVGACGQVTTEPVCEVDGEGYVAGESFRAPNSTCNTCTCQEDGTTLCTRLACSDPGCDVDGVHHDVGESFTSPDGCNTCGCEDDGVVSCTLRACAEPICGGLLGAGCSDGRYCDLPEETRCGSGDQTGVCRARPEGCDDIYSPVCGCDNHTYSNACEASSAGVSVASAGPCDAECQTDAGCPQRDCACPDDNGDGVCDQPCPVSRCVAGRCELLTPEPALGEGDACGGFRLPGSGACSPGLFCQHQPGALCGAADAPGECVTIPTACIEIFEPVCGCNGITYSNACHAAVARVGILDVGECQP